MTTSESKSSDDFKKNLKSMFAEFKQIREPENTILEEKIEGFSDIENFKCPFCKESTLLVEDGSFVCTSCGKENGVIISDKQEWRSYADSYGGDTSRCGMPSNPLLPQSSLGTISTGNTKYGFSRMQIQNAMPSHEKARLDAIKIIKSASDKLEISGVLSDMACYLYVKLTENAKVKRGPVRVGLMANCQYAICKRKGQNYYICPEILSEAYKIKMKHFNEGSKEFAKFSFYKTKCNDTEKQWGSNLIKSRLSFIKPTEPEDIIRTVCEKLSFNEIDIASVIYITRNVKKSNIISSKNPQSIAAGCILLYVKEKEMKHIKSDNISNFCGVSITTANYTYNELKKDKLHLFPKDKNDLMNGNVGDCIPEVELSKIYTAPKRAQPPSIIIDNTTKKVNVSRGRPKKVK